MFCKPFFFVTNLLEESPSLNIKGVTVYQVDFKKIDRKGRVYIENLKTSSGKYRGQHKVSK